MGQMFSFRMFSSGREGSNHRPNDGSRDFNGRPRSPPRDLSSILKSVVLTNDFRTFLADIDEDADEGPVRVTWLNFVLSCQRLRDLHDAHDVPNKKGAVKLYLGQMREEYFGDDRRVALSSQATWNACEALCVRGKGDLTPMWRAHQDVVRSLDGLHQPFLLEHRAGRMSLPDVIQQCLL